MAVEELGTGPEHALCSNNSSCTDEAVEVDIEGVQRIGIYLMKIILAGTEMTCDCCLFH